MKTLVVLVFALSVFFIGCGSNSEDKTTMEKVRQLYEQAKEAGEDIPDDIVEWVKKDYSRVGTWEYKVISLQAQQDEAVEKKLNALGEKRWECFFVERKGNTVRLILKRPVKSYLQAVPAKELMRLF